MEQNLRRLIHAFVNRPRVYDYSDKGEPTKRYGSAMLEWTHKTEKILREMEKELRELKLDEAPYKGQYTGQEMIAIHLFIQKEILGEADQ